MKIGIPFNKMTKLSDILNRASLYACKQNSGSYHYLRSVFIFSEATFQSQPLSDQPITLVVQLLIKSSSRYVFYIAEVWYPNKISLFRMTLLIDVLILSLFLISAFLSLLRKVTLKRVLNHFISKQRWVWSLSNGWLV